MKKLTWKTEKRKVKELIPFPDNPRTISEEQKKQLEKSITKFDLAEIPCINTDNMIIAGHQRLQVLMTLNRGDEIIDVRVPNRKLTKAELKEYNIRSNKTHAEFDFVKLLDSFNMNDLLNWGFSSSDLHYNANNDVTRLVEFHNKTKWILSVELKDERTTKSLYDKLSKQGYSCKIIN